MKARLCLTASTTARAEVTIIIYQHQHLTVVSTTTMADLSGDAFVQALQSETVTLLVGPSAEPLTVSKALLCLKSDTFARLLSKPDLTELRLQGVGVVVSKIFVCWCYQVCNTRCCVRTLLLY